ncbi:helix-turn-helix transcriptional regulator [Mycobacteroides franklinii]|nr:helix-turn-helix transcriptional regulator [Mycobacteroides franklinii]ORA61037.1 hypothetical protein BST24_12315 [Mycobacteroides franklinii]
MRLTPAATMTSPAEIDFSFISQDIDGSFDCTFRQPHHLVLVHLAGNLEAKEYELEKAGSRRIQTPTIGSAWVLPAEQHGSGNAIGHTTAQYCQLTVPHKAFGSRDLLPTVGPDPLLHQLVARIGSVRDRDDVPARLLREALTETVLRHLADRYGTPVPQRQDGSPTELDQTAQAAIVEFLADSLDSNISLQDMADFTQMPVRLFVKAFTSAFHTTPHQYILDQRIAQAKALLSTTTLPITEISANLGFSSPSHLTTTFKNRVGVTPNQYRQVS